MWERFSTVGRSVFPLRVAKGSSEVVARRPATFPPLERRPIRERSTAIWEDLTARQLSVLQTEDFASGVASRDLRVLASNATGARVFQRSVVDFLYNGALRRTELARLETVLV